ncbi:MAG: (Na+)-NQR maturation NqrM [Porticoccaceae bacterium]
MIEFLLALGVLLLLIAGMSIGVLMGRKPIAGSCGGMAALGMEVECDICGGDTTKCVEPGAGTEASRQQLAYDAAEKP